MQEQILTCGKHRLVLGSRTLIMGILNTTPDSFSDGGQYIDPEAAVVRARQMVAQGADIIDIGGESTRPGADKVSQEEELRRVIPVIRAIAEQLDIPISIDTYKAEVALQALEAGAHIINDIWGGKADPQMIKVAAQYDCPIILMHNRQSKSYQDFLGELVLDIQESIDLALQGGVKPSNIILDPGIGFAKTGEQNLTLMNHLSIFAELGYPVLLGTSRKTFIRHTLNLPANDVVEGTLATTALGIMQGCQIVRVHDVLQNKRTAQMVDEIRRHRLSQEG